MTLDDTSILWVGSVLCWAGAVAIWVATLLALRRASDRLSEVTHLLEGLAAAAPIEPGTMLSTTVGIRPGSAIISGVAVDRVRTAAAAATQDGWADR